MPKHPTTKPAAVDYFKVPRRLWRLTKKHLPAEPKPSHQGFQKSRERFPAGSCPRCEPAPEYEGRL